MKYMVKWLIPILCLAACKVTFITGYDAVIDETATRMKKEFNLHFIKLARTIQDNNPTNQNISNFRDYYDNLEADLIVLRDRGKFLGAKSEIVKKQIVTLDSAMHTFIALHERGMPDRPGDDRRDVRNAINSNFDAVIALQEQLKSKGKIDKE
jgi:hypothetical protein